MSLRLAFIIASAVYLSACAKEMDKFIQGAVKPLPPGNGGIIGAAEYGNHFSAGHLRDAGTSRGIVVSVGPTTQQLKGARLGMSVGFSKSPVK